MSSRAKIVLSTFLGAAAAAATLATAGGAAAYVDKYPAYSCATNKPSAVGAYDLYGVGTGLFCPIPSTLEKPISKVQRLIVKGYDGNTNGGVAVEACVKYRNALGGSCGYTRASFVSNYSGGGTTGNFTVQLADEYLRPLRDFPDDFAYLHVSLLGSNSASPDHVYGYTVADQLVLDGPITLAPL